MFNWNYGTHCKLHNYVSWGVERVGFFAIMILAIIANNNYCNGSDWGRAIGAFSPYTALQNQTGMPAMSTPLFWNDEGLPIGVMFTAPYAREDLLFSLATQLEAARPWVDRRPPVCAA